MELRKVFVYPRKKSKKGGGVYTFPVIYDAHGRAFVTSEKHKAIAR